MVMIQSWEMKRYIIYNKYQLKTRDIKRTSQDAKQKQRYLWQLRKIVQRRSRAYQAWIQHKSLRPNGNPKTTPVFQLALRLGISSLVARMPMLLSSLEIHGTRNAP